MLKKVMLVFIKKIDLLKRNFVVIEPKCGIILKSSRKCTQIIQRHVWMVGKLIACATTKTKSVYIEGNHP